MIEKIIAHLDDPKQLESLYRDNPSEFRKAFNTAYPEIQNNITAQVWNERLNFEMETIPKANNRELFFVIVAALIAGFFAKIPDLFGVREDFFYPRNMGFIVFPFLTAYFLWKQQLSTKIIFIISSIFFIAFIYINFLPDNSKSDTLILACIHLPLFLWAITGYSFIGGHVKNYSRRLDFLRYNGDLIVMTSLILIAGAILTAITIGLFHLIGVNIEDFYFKYIVVFGLAASPMVATYLVQSNPQLVNRVSPVIAKVFTPLVLITLVFYLFAVIATGKDPYNDREFLLIFNLLLIGVMAIILFSIAETSKNAISKFNLILLFALAVVTVIVNGIALSAILFRIAQWGFTPNRLAVLGGNLLILINLIQVTAQLFKSLRNQNELENIEKRIAQFLPVYTLWTIVVTFIFPIIFLFK